MPSFNLPNSRSNMERSTGPELNIRWGSTFSRLTSRRLKNITNQELHGRRESTSSAGNFTTVSKPAKDLPTEVDWRKQGVVTDVKNQGQCGSCWAFCTTEMIESYAGIATGSTPELSSQQVTSC